MVGDAQKNAHVLKEILDKLQCKAEADFLSKCHSQATSEAKAKKERSKDEDEEAKDADTSSSLGSTDWLFVQEVW